MTRVTPDISSWNWNLFAASLLIRVWKRLGITHYFVSPGYRDAPLIAALQAEPGLTLLACFDERAAAFEALGFAKATGRPGVLVCTSGTAGANYLPAVIEASVDQLPMMVVTADRPFELVYAAAQQVIDQHNLYGRFVRTYRGFPAPGPGLAIRAWLSYARDLLVRSCSYPAGPVHINLPLKMPLDPIVDSKRPSPEELALLEDALREMPATWWPHPAPDLPSGAQAVLGAQLKQAERGLLLIGRLADSDEQETVLAIQRDLAWPTYCDIGSKLKGRCREELPDPQLPRLSAWLEAYRPDFVLHLGRRLVTRYFDDFLAKYPPRSYWVLSREQGVQDPSHVASRQQLEVDLSRLRSWPVWTGIRRQDSQLQALRELRSEVQETSEIFGFAAVAQEILEHAPLEGHGLFLGNSTAIRAFDSWCLRSQRWPRVEANRGVSGIEGLLSTTLGLALGSGHGWTAVLGDISLMHDLNSLLRLRQQDLFVIVVLVNNSGGRIFEALPIGKHEWVKDPLITTPHSFSFEGLAHMAQLPYQRCSNADEFRRAYSQGLTQRQALLIECTQTATADAAYLQRWKEEGRVR